MRAHPHAADRQNSAERAGASLVRDFVVILGAELVGEMLQRVTGIAVPGPVLGLICLLILLIARGGAWGTLGTSARGLLRYFPVLFVPAGAGVAAHFELIRAEWVPIVASLVGSSIVAILVTAWTMHTVERWRQRRDTRPQVRAVPIDREHHQ